MIIADKIIKLRKKNAWSQEELAEKMNVSRQAVSKWEGAQSIPDLEKILQLSVLFGVTTDYLLKDELEAEEYSSGAYPDTVVKKISLEEANTYMEQRKKAARYTALATFLCILSPVTLLVLSILSGLPNPPVSEVTAGALGLTVLFACVLCAVPLFLYCGFMNQPYAFLDKNVPFELEYGVKGIITEKKNAFRATYAACNMIATVLCIFAAVPLVLLSFTGNELLLAAALALLMLLVGIGTGMFILAGIQNASMEKLLKEGDYTVNGKNRTRIKETVGSCYWVILTAIYFAVSFITDRWNMSWLIFAVGGILYPVTMHICNLIADKREKN